MNSTCKFAPQLFPFLITIGKHEKEKPFRIFFNYGPLFSFESNAINTFIYQYFQISINTALLLLFPQNLSYACLFL